MIECSLLKSIFSLDERCPFVFFEWSFEFDGVFSGDTHKISYKCFAFLEKTQIDCLKYPKKLNSLLKSQIVFGGSRSFSRVSVFIVLSRCRNKLRLPSPNSAVN